MGEGKVQCKIFTIFCVLFLAHLAVNAQEAENSTDWDNQFFAGNKVVYGVDKWKYSGELQFRMKDDFQARGGDKLHPSCCTPHVMMV